MSCKYLNVAGFLDNSLVNGEGMRSVLFVSGCNHNCDGCHNKEMQNPNYGEKISVEKIFRRIMGNYPLVKGVTFSGGEPFDSANGLKTLARMIKEGSDMNIWCYTGYTYEEIMKSDNSEWHELLKHIDVLIDGKFDKNLMNPELKYRGSSNQRIIDLGKINDEGILIQAS